MRVLRPQEQRLIHDSVAVSLSDRLQQNGLTREEMLIERLTVAVPQLFPGDAPAKRPLQKTRQSSPELVVEPDQCIGPRRDDVTHDSIVRIHNPDIARYRPGNLLAEDIVRGIDPVGTMSEAIHLNVRSAQEAGERSRQSRLSCRYAACDYDALVHFAR